LHVRYGKASRISLALPLFKTDALAKQPEGTGATETGKQPAAQKKRMLRRTSKIVKEVVDKMRLPAVVRLGISFFSNYAYTNAEKLKFVMRQLTFMTAGAASCRGRKALCFVAWSSLRTCTFASR
jgi:hypothetical protein